MAVAKKTQASFEFIVIVSVLFVIVAIFTSMNNDALVIHNDRIRINQAKDVVNEIYKGSTLVYHEGEGARIKIFVNIPNYVNATSVDNGIIEMNLSVNNNIVSTFRKVDFTITGDIPMEKGYYWISLISNGTSVDMVW